MSDDEFMRGIILKSAQHNVRMASDMLLRIVAIIAPDAGIEEKVRVVHAFGVIAMNRAAALVMREDPALSNNETTEVVP